jgi:2'-hydroxyisoflavone reductase
MKMLFLGGTKFVGRHIAEAAIRAGHDVTFFNRGVSNASLFPDERHLQGDRAGDVSVLSTIDADVVIDTSGYTPAAVTASARAVAGRVAKYVFMSSVDAYDLSAPSIDETSATKVLGAGESRTELVPELYGAQKARCEQELVEILGAARVLAVRAGLMVGPHDATDRFTYWPARIARGGEVLAPVGPAFPVQLIDVRDVADWVVARALDCSGVFNLVGTPRALDLGSVFDACVAASERTPTFTWVTPEFLAAHAVNPWVEMPLWLPESPELAGLLTVSNERARATGLRIRPVLETVRDVLDELRARPPERTLRAGLDPDFEERLLRAWHVGPAAGGVDSIRSIMGTN